MHAWINITHPGFSGRQDMPDDGDQWVSWKQMVAMLRAKGNADGRAAQLAREVIELRGEVAKLKPLEMILAKGGDPVQHLSEAVLDLSEKLRSAEDATRIMDREYFGLNNKLREARAEIDLLKETAQAHAVVVPEIDCETWNRIWHGSETMVKAMRLVSEWYLANARAVPADRVLGDGMVAVPVEEWRHIATLIIHLIGDEDALDKIDNLVDPIGKVREERHGNGWIGVMMEEAGIVSSPTEIDDFFVCPPDALRANQGGAGT